MKIESLAPSKKVKGRFLIHLDEGTILRVSEQELIDFSLYQGKEISCEEAEELEKSAQKSQLKQKAMNILSRKSISRRDLEKKLLQINPDHEEITRICDRLEELEMLNDERYAHQLARHYAAKGYGTRRITQEFYAHSVPREFWEQALEELDDGSAAIDKFITQKCKGQKPDEKLAKKVTDALVRRGFSWSDIRAGMVRYDEEMAEIWEIDS